VEASTGSRSTIVGRQRPQRGREPTQRLGGGAVIEIASAGGSLTGAGGGSPDLGGGGDQTLQGVDQTSGVGSGHSVLSRKVGSHSEASEKVDPTSRSQERSERSWANLEGPVASANNRPDPRSRRTSRTRAYTRAYAREHPGARSPTPAVPYAHAREALAWRRSSRSAAIRSRRPRSFRGERERCRV
jgi:hypothetical protein